MKKKKPNVSIMPENILKEAGFRISKAMKATKNESNRKQGAPTSKRPLKKEI